MAEANPMLSLDALTFDTAQAALEQGCVAIRAGETVFDLGGVRTADSSGVALLLAWKRAARKAGVSLSYVNIPAGLQSLAALYGVDDFLVESPANLQHH